MKIRKTLRVAARVAVGEDRKREHKDEDKRTVNGDVYICLLELPFPR